MGPKKSTTTIQNEDHKINVLIHERINRVRDIIRNTSLSAHTYKSVNIFSNSEITVCINSLNELFIKTTEILDQLNTNTIETTIDLLQMIIDKLSTVISTVGTKNMDDLLYMTFGSSVLDGTYDECMRSKFELIRKYIHPVGFKLVPNNTTSCADMICINKIMDQCVHLETAPLFECFEYDAQTTSFHYKVHGIRVVFRCKTSNKVVIVSGMVDEIPLNLFKNAYISQRMDNIMSTSQSCDMKLLQNQIDTMTLKDILVYGDDDIIKKNRAIIHQANLIKTETLDTIIKKFISLDLVTQRTMLIELLTCVDNDELKYISYLLYDLISNEGADSGDQTMIYDSLPHKIKRLFKDAMSYTMKQSQSVTPKSDVGKASLEQQVYFMRAPAQVKEKALSKLKEIRGKSEESGGKSRQYLEGLLRIPFGVIREEPILCMLRDINHDFSILREKYPISDIPTKNNYTNAEIYMYISKYEERIQNTMSEIGNGLDKITKSGLKQITKDVESIKWYKFKTRLSQLAEIKRFLETAPVSSKIAICNVVYPDRIPLIQSKDIIDKIRCKLLKFEEALKNIDTVFDASVYGHTHAKKQIKKIICQWMTGKQNGGAFGFEGSPGLGKTSLAKHGIAKCLVDENGKPRPFTFIALGGSCNGSTLEGHGFTYVNSTWGLIVDAMMNAGCENPIFYFDELDKISKSEHGNEIVGILTHLIDSTQNDVINDKFFHGVPLNLSKALFIFSYNDPALIDPILLDRIHRIKFENLSLDDKMVIGRDYIIPEMNNRMGMIDTIQIPDDVIQHIIQCYTMEPGVRKLKEIFFDLYGEINLDMLNDKGSDIKIPITITSDLVDTKYLIKYHKIDDYKIHTRPMVGIVNGLYANSLGKGGVLVIEVSFFPSSTFLELKLTGLQGDVMKESMNVAKTLAWSLCSQEIKDKLMVQFEQTKCQGLHIHCTGGSISKEGPSAGMAETVGIYSLFNDLPIMNTVAMTGEIDLRGNITAIGGLDCKISGGLRAGVTKFLYPDENAKDFADLKKKRNLPENIQFISQNNIRDVFTHVFV